MQELYDITKFKPNFNKFVKENDFGTSVYMIVYKSKDFDMELKDFIIRLKYCPSEEFEEVVYENIPPYYMKKLKDLVEKYKNIEV